MSDSSVVAVAMAAAAAASAVNAIAGGGMLIAFPVLVATGIPPIVANATSTVGLFPGGLSGAIGYRKSLTGTRVLQRQMMLTSALGGAVGAFALTHTSDLVFSRVVPWLILLATLLFAFGPRIANAGDDAVRVEATRLSSGSVAIQLAVGVYGGYFGAGAGFVMLAMFHAMGLRDVHRMNGLKLVAGLGMNAAAIVVFVLRDVILWKLALMMAVAAIVSGQLTARVAQRVNQRYVRAAVVCFGLASSAYLFGSMR